ncbi:hypothetical protein JK361_10755 [Streptomyces sp. 5-8]|uniref:Translation initiation factor IF-2 n=1 Tax=Streptomyces musisoli TaxID=2802280 RepID=A0ABS1NY79_9ACTN|nr:hypothetical protein [Streptomyces musisoli]MBL1105064.1 hypothetical protein [Streptomyces musisoli]
MDALMAAITGDPLPEEARRDPAFLAGHRAAETDVAVLRDQLAWLAEALTGEVREETAGGAVPGDAAPGGAVTRDVVTEDAVPRDASGVGASASGTSVVDASVGGTSVVDASVGGASVGDALVGGASAEDAVRVVPPARRPRSRTRPAGPARPPRPRRPGGPRRALRIALGSLAGAAAFALALGFGWLVTQGGPAGDNGGSVKRADAASAESGTDWRLADPERELACSRLVVEGTVTRVERQGQDASSRVTLTVSRSYKPAEGPGEADFLLDPGTRPVPRPGQHVLAAVGRGERYASLWAVGDARVAAERARITDALPGSRNLPCPSDESP